MLLTQIKQRRIKNSKMQGQKAEGGGANDTPPKSNKKLKTADNDILDSKKEQESATFQDEIAMPFDFEDGLFSKYCSFGRDELSHLFLQNDGDLSVKFQMDE
jgi:hypothetical protein